MEAGAGEEIVVHVVGTHDPMLMGKYKSGKLDRGLPLSAFFKKKKVVLKVA